jgi:hypothetical protein
MRCLWWICPPHYALIERRHSCLDRDISMRRAKTTLVGVSTPWEAYAPSTWLADRALPSLIRNEYFLARLGYRAHASRHSPAGVSHEYCDANEYGICPRAVEVLVYSQRAVCTPGSSYPANRTNSLSTK